MSVYAANDFIHRDTNYNTTNYNSPRMRNGPENRQTQYNTDLQIV